MAGIQRRTILLWRYIVRWSDERRRHSRASWISSRRPGHCPQA